MSRIIKFVRFMHSQKGLSPKTVFNFFYHLPNLLRLSARLLRDPRVPRRLKIYCGLAVGYLLMPFDVVPDLLLPLFGIGVADDVTFIFLAFHKLIKDSPSEVVEEHVRAIGRDPRPATTDQDSV
ncbi:MAG: DUF1232 domain-containing protein [FCB group bacterium]|jgi:uncharacterized membrane protein YkvA (DUF1232 family)|nr:DUF1232 domain-containing protein [FCB group bacterium]